MKLAGNGLYAITNGPRPDLLESVDAALRGGARVIQYRDKTPDTSRRLAEARALAGQCASYGVALIINDDVELAAMLSHGGVHIGKNDVDVATARKRLGASAIIGVSCYDSIGRAREAAASGADYLAFGAFFPSPTKPNAPRATVDLLHSAKPFGLPLVAIGGVTPDNAPTLIAAGADYVAAISAVFGGADIEGNAARFSKLFT